MYLHGYSKNWNDVHLKFLSNNGLFISYRDWLIDWLIDWMKFYAISAIFQPSYRDCIHPLNEIIPDYHKVRVFSSPELKAQVSFSDHLSSVVCLSIRLSVNFSHFHRLLQNHWANFNQTKYTKYPWVKGIQVCSNEGPRPFPRGNYFEIVKVHWRN